MAEDLESLSREELERRFNAAYEAPRDFQASLLAWWEGVCPQLLEAVTEFNERWRSERTEAAADTIKNGMAELYRGPRQTTT